MTPASKQVSSAGFNAAITEALVDKKEVSVKTSGKAQEVKEEKADITDAPFELSTESKPASTEPKGPDQQAESKRQEQTGENKSAEPPKESKPARQSDTPVTTEESEPSKPAEPVPDQATNIPSGRAPNDPREVRKRQTSGKS